MRLHAHARAPIAGSTASWFAIARRALLHATLVIGVCTGFAGMALDGFARTGSAPARDDWPQFRGANRDGLAPSDGLARAWPESGPVELWRSGVGAGFSGVASVGDRLYTLGAEGETEDVVCVDAKTGKVVWRTPLGERFKGQFGDGGRSTPTVVGDAVYAATSDMKLGAFDAKSGELKWKVDLIETYGARKPRFGFAPSPLVEKDTVLIEVGGQDPGKWLVGFDIETGEEKWSALDGNIAGSASPLVLDLHGTHQFVFHRLQGNNRSEAVSIDASGNVLWSFPIAVDTICMPLFVAPDRFFASSASRGDGGKMVRVTHGEDGFATEELWTERRMRNHFNNSVLVGGHLYGFDNSTLRCLDAETGEKM